MDKLTSEEANQLISHRIQKVKDLLKEIQEIADASSETVYLNLGWGGATYYHKDYVDYDGEEMTGWLSSSYNC